MATTSGSSTVPALEAKVAFLEGQISDLMSKYKTLAENLSSKTNDQDLNPQSPVAKDDKIHLDT